MSMVLFHILEKLTKFFCEKAKGYLLYLRLNTQNQS